MLLFNPDGIDESLEAGLANGHLNPNELAGQKITVLITEPERWQYGPEVFELAKRIPGIDFVFNYKPTAGSADTPDPSVLSSGRSQREFFCGWDSGAYDSGDWVAVWVISSKPTE